MDLVLTTGGQIVGCPVFALLIDSSRLGSHRQRFYELDPPPQRHRPRRVKQT
jgi:hypothetical protein